MEKTVLEMLNELAQTIYDKKAFNITAIDVRGISSLTDYLLIAEGSVDRHVQALGKLVEEKAREVKLKVFHLEGNSSGDWIVIDCGEIMVHLFVPEMREKYRLEQMWPEGTIVDLDLQIKTGEQ